MLTKNKIGIIAYLVLAFAIPQNLSAERPKPAPQIPVITETIAPTPQEAWIAELEQCESSGNPNAVNPKDLDGTPSYGAFQFKPGTFYGLEKAYGIAGPLMDPVAQRAIVARMINDPSMNIHWQFPDCTRKIGLPPKPLT